MGLTKVPPDLFLMLINPILPKLTVPTGTVIPKGLMKLQFCFILKAPVKNESEKKLSAQVICCIHLLTLLTYASKEANSMAPDQTSPIGTV